MIEVPSTEYDTEFSPGTAKKAYAAAGAKKLDDTVMVPLDSIKIPEGFNVRIQNAAYEDRIDEIADSIVVEGFYRHMPLKGYVGKDGDNDVIFCTGGFTRLAAAKKARARGYPIDAVPVALTQAGTNTIDLLYGLENDNSGKPLKPYERGIVVKRLAGFGQDEETIAKRMGRSLNYIRELLYLHSLPQALQQLVIDDRVAAGHATHLSREHGPEKALALIREALDTQDFDAPPLAEDVDEALEQSGRAGRVRPRHTKKAGLSKKTFIAAIKYAIALPSDGIEFLSRWLEGDKDAVSEVEAVMAGGSPKKKAEATPKKTKGVTQAEADAAAMEAISKAADNDVDL